MTPNWQIALAAHAEVLAIQASDVGQRQARAWCGDRLARYGRDAATSAWLAFQDRVEDLLAADPIYVTEEMQGLVYRAMETFDGSEPMADDDLFLREGFAYLEHPFVTIDNKGKRLSFRAVSWRYCEVLVDDANLDREKPETEGCIKMMLWSHIDDPDDYPLPDDWKQALRMQGDFWGVAHATVLPMRLTDIGPHVSNEGDPKATWLVFFRVLQRLMAEKIVVKEKRQVDRAEWRRAKRKGLDVRTVRVVELRRRSENPEAKGGTRNYTHQWIVGGFWRNQYYPSTDTHRQKYIADYVKGPKDKPLIVKDRVWVWDR